MLRLYLPPGLITDLDQTTASLAMFPDELTYIEEIFLYLNEAVSDKPITAPKLTSKHIEALKAVLDRWPAHVRFPRTSFLQFSMSQRTVKVPRCCTITARHHSFVLTRRTSSDTIDSCHTVVDLSRLVIGYCAPTFADPALRQAFLASLFQAAEFNEPWRTPLPKSRETNVLLLLRATANLFQDGTSLTSDGDWAKWVRVLRAFRLGVIPSSLVFVVSSILWFLGRLGIWLLRYTSPPAGPRDAWRSTVHHPDEDAACGARDRPVQVRLSFC